MNDWALWDNIRSRAARTPAHPAFVEMSTGRSITYAELVDAVQNAEPASEARVMLASANTIEFPIAFLSNLLHKRSVFPMSFDTPVAEVDRAKAKTERLPTLAETQGEILLCSSGTTGLPKIVRRSRRSLDVVARQMVDGIGLNQDDVFIAAVPLVHSYGVEHGLLAPLQAGATVLLCEGMNVPQLMQAMQSGATVFPAVPSILELLGRSLAPAHKLRRVYSAGAPLPTTVADAFAGSFGVRVGQIYGLTEVGSVFYNDPERDAPTSVGRPFAGVCVRLLREDDSHDGEVAIRSESMLDAYVNEPLTLVDGHFPTGDLGRISTTDELHLTGRLRLLIDVGGAKVNPLEVEQVLMRHPRVGSAVVVPLRLSETVNKVRAIVVPVDPALPPDVQELRQLARAELAAYKVPRVIEIRESLPRSPTGKILRAQLGAV